MAQFWLGLFGGGVSQRGELLLVRGEPGALEIQGRDLAFERAHRPVATDAFHLVEHALERVFKRRQ